MARHKNQTSGYGKPLGPTSPTPPTARAAQLLARARGKTIEQVAADRPLKPPGHVCDFGQASGRCKRCGMPEVDST